MTTVWVIDIDNTIADNTHRQWLLKKQCRICLSEVSGKHNAGCDNCGSCDIHTPQSGWDAFISPEYMLADKPVESAQRALTQLRKLGVEYHYLTGRSDSARDATHQWLAEHFDFDSSINKLLMRNKSYRGISASDYKEMQFQKLRDTYPKDTSFIFAEDDPYVFTMYSKYGIVLRCPDAWDSMFPPGFNRKLEPQWHI